MWKKAFAGAGAVSIVLCWPFITGQIGERIYLDSIAKNKSPYLTITNEKYDRGYLSSNVISKIVVKDEYKSLFEEDGLPTSWTLDHHIKHGFFHITSDSTVQLTDIERKKADAIWGKGVQPVTLETETALNGNTEFTFTVNPIHYQSELGEKVDSKAFVLSGDMDVNGKGNFQYQLPQFDVTTVAKETMALSGLKGGGDGQFVDQFWIGSQFFDLAAIKLATAEDTQHIQASDIKVTMSNVLSQPKNAVKPTEATEQVTNTNAVSVGQFVTLDGQKFTNFNFKMAFENLNYQAITELSKMTNPADGQLSQQDVDAAAHALDVLVEQGVIFNLEDLSVKTEQGDINSYMKLIVAPGLKNSSQNIAAITKQLTGDLSLVAPKALVDNNPDVALQIKALKKMGVIEQKENTYDLSMKVEGDHLVLASGAKLPLSKLLIPFM